MDERSRLGADTVANLPPDIQPLCTEAIRIITALGFPRQQQNVRSGLTLLALAGLRGGMTWQQASNPLLGIRPILDIMRQDYGRPYAENSRETVRRQTIHQFQEAAFIQINPDKPKPATTSADTAYQLTSEALSLLRAFGTEVWPQNVAAYLETRPSLVERYARERAMARIPIDVPGLQLRLSPGGQNVLVAQIITEFCSRFVRNPHFIYVGDTGGQGGKTLHYDPAYLAALGVTLEAHGKFPDLIVHDRVRNWLLLIEAVTSHGPVDGKRHDELARLFAGSTDPIVYVTAFRDRATMARYTARIDWATEVWCADSPTHMIHFNGQRFLGPYVEDKEM